MHIPILVLISLFFALYQSPASATSGVSARQLQAFRHKREEFARRYVSKPSVKSLAAEHSSRFLTEKSKSQLYQAAPW